MAEEIVHKQEFVIRDLSTRSVTLYPAKAQVIRDIEDVVLKQGANEITIYGLTPTADESSIKADGKGSATITDMMVDLIPNREIYEEVYPEESDEEDSDEPDGEQDSSEDESYIIRALAREKEENEDALKKANENKASASSQLAMLETYGRSLDKDRPNDLEACVSAYSEERKRAFAVHFASESEIKSLKIERIKITKKQNKALHTTRKEKEKAEKERAKKLVKKFRASLEKKEAKERLKEDRIQFWPRKVYRVVLSIDTNADMTPGSSRRGSIDTLAKPTSESSAGSCQISLSISYITHSAWWAPRYELSLDSPNGSGLILYRAEYCNTTSEVWKGAKVTLSTSQTSFQGLGEPIPSIQPWHIRLSKASASSQGIDHTRGALFSTYEMQHKHRGQMAVSNKAKEPRNALFGLGNHYVPDNIFGTKHPQMQQRAQQQVMQQPQSQRLYQQQAQASSLFGAPGGQAPQQAQAGGLFGSSNKGGGLFANKVSNTSGFSATQSNNNAQASLFGSSNTGSIPLAASVPFGAAPADHSGESTNYSIEYDESGGIDEKPDTVVPDLPSLAAQESEWSESGLTASYDIPGRRTIAPSHTMRRHKIASISLKDVHLSYLMVPKLRMVAFLKVRIRNTSDITLLKGPVGLTLDGTFLGNASLPRCSAGEPFSLSLGVDPSVSVTYAKPVVKRSQTGVFQKEGSGVYTRTITITNTKSNRPLEGVVLDQVPVSEDERLKVDILQPAGLHSEGDSAKSGTSIAAAGKATEKWGTARAVLKKGAEVCWNVKIEPGRGVRLVLEYEARFPSTELVVGC